jgi:predicted regulator of Ras-like GTPase activity (Roadblock/LC7/MglB family)
MFREILKEAVDEVPGAMGAIFADWEGEAVDHYFSGEDDEIKLVGAHQGILLNLMKTASDNVGLGGVNEVMLVMDGAKVMARPLKDGYFLVLLVENGCNSGIARRTLRRTALLLDEEI